jgi:hypothetical protein
LAASTSSRRLPNEPVNGQPEKPNILNLALAGVRANAEAHNIARKSPEKIYSGVKSKVAGNIKSIKKAQTRSQVQKVNSAAKTEQEATYTDASPMKQTSASSALSR